MKEWKGGWKDKSTDAFSAYVGWLALLKKTGWQVVLGSWQKASLIGCCAVSQQAGSREDGRHFGMSQLTSGAGKEWEGKREKGSLISQI